MRLMNRGMTSKQWICFLCLSLFTLGCTGRTSDISKAEQNDGISPSPTIVKSKQPETENPSTRKLLDRIQQISQAAQGKVGVAATLLETGESVAFNGNQRFPMQSVYKFPIGMAVLAQVDQGKLKLEQQVQVKPDDFVLAFQHSPIRDKNPQGTELSVTELLKYMMSESDGTACDVLLRLVGGPKVVSEYLRDLGVENIVVANTEKELGQTQSVQYQNWATPEATLTLLTALHEGKGLSASSRALLLQLMTETPTGPKRIKGQLPKGTVVAHKTGSSQTVDGVTAATNDVGLVTLPNGQHFAIAVFVSDAKADKATREATIAKIAKVIWDEWSR